MPELKKGVLYYQLEPVYSKGSRIFVPVGSDKLVMRKLVSAEEVEALMNEIPSIETMWIANEKKREEQYREATPLSQSAGNGSGSSRPFTRESAAGLSRGKRSPILMRNI